jgi:hypothetical protein
MAAHRLDPSPLPLSPSDRLHLLLALGSALTGTPWGVAMAGVVVSLVVARRWARRSLCVSAAVRRGVLTPAQGAGVLHPTGHRREAIAHP